MSWRRFGAGKRKEGIGKLEGGRIVIGDVKVIRSFARRRGALR